MSLDISQIISQIIAFTLMLLILKKFGWKPLMEVLESRQNKIHAEFDSIANQQKKLDTLIKTYEDKLQEIETEARHTINNATAEGRKIAADIQADAQAKTRQMLTQATQEIDREVSQAIIHLKKDVVNMVVDISEKFMRENLDDKKHKLLIEDFVEGSK